MSQQLKPKKQADYYPNELIFIQSRAEVNFSIISEYAQMMEDGVVFDAVEGIQDENGEIFIFDGYHRGEAAKKVGTTLLVNLRPGNQTEAEWLALTANQKHGLCRSNADKQRVVHRALLHPYGVNLSNSELACHCGVSDKTVARIRRELEASSEIPRIEKRIIKRDGVVYEQNTRNIGNVQTKKHVSDPGLHKPSATQVNANANGSNHSLTFDNPSQCSEVSGLAAQPGNVKSSDYQSLSQEFECPCCGQDKIVGVNGSRRWCLNCGAEWPTATELLAEVNTAQNQTDIVPTRTALQQRFSNILANLDEQAGQLTQVELWLDELERRLVLSADLQPAAEAVAPTLAIHSIPILEYA